MYELIYLYIEVQEIMDGEVSVPTINGDVYILYFRSKEDFESRPEMLENG